MSNSMRNSGEESNTNLNQPSEDDVTLLIRLANDIKHYPRDLKLLDEVQRLRSKGIFDKISDYKQEQIVRSALKSIDYCIDVELFEAAALLKNANIKLDVSNVQKLKVMEQNGLINLIKFKYPDLVGEGGPIDFGSGQAAEELKKDKDKKFASEIMMNVVTKLNELEQYTDIIAPSLDKKSEIKDADIENVQKALSNPDTSGEKYPMYGTYAYEEIVGKFSPKRGCKVDDIKYERVDDNRHQFGFMTNADASTGYKAAYKIIELNDNEIIKFSNQYLKITADVNKKNEAAREVEIKRKQEEEKEQKRMDNDPVVRGIINYLESTSSLKLSSEIDWFWQVMKDKDGKLVISGQGTGSWGANTQASEVGTYFESLQAVFGKNNVDEVIEQLSGAMIKGDGNVAIIISNLKSAHNSMEEFKKLTIKTLLQKGKHETYDSRPGKTYLVFDSPATFNAACAALATDPTLGSSYRVAGQANTIEIMGRIQVIGNQIGIKDLPKSVGESKSTLDIAVSLSSSSPNISSSSSSSSSSLLKSFVPSTPAEHSSSAVESGKSKAGSPNQTLDADTSSVSPSISPKKSGT